MKNVMMFNDEDIEEMSKQVEAENEKSGDVDDMEV
jgi:hypothetical protein